MDHSKSTAKGYLSDSGASLLRSVAGGVAGIIVNPLVIRSLTEEQYSGWVLALSVGAYVSFAENGVGTAVVRYVSSDRSGKETATVKFVATAGAFTAIAGLSAIGLVSGLTFLTGFFFGDAPADLYRSLRFAAIFCMVSSFFGLWTNTANSYFLARHQSMRGALVSIGTIVVNSIAIVLVARRFHSIVALSVAVCSIATVQAILLLFLIAKQTGRRVVYPSSVNRVDFGRIWSHCVGTGWWSVATLLISGLDLLIVARVDFGSVGAYGIAGRLMLLVLTLLSATTTPLLSVAARIHSAGEPAAVTRFLVKSSRYVNCLNALLSGVFFVAAPGIVGLFAGRNYIDPSVWILRFLLIGNFIRQLGGVLGVVMVATGEHRKAVIPPIAEGLVNVVVSVVLGTWLGAVGVAIGTVCGATVTVVLYVLYVFPKFTAFELSWGVFFSDFLKPSLFILAPPTCLCLAFDSTQIYKSFSVATISGLFSFAILVMVGLTKNDRATLTKKLRKAIGLST
jgi:O-antigen/teichoic acid export membrane protein